MPRIEIELPDFPGYELATGKQPRPVKHGEWFLPVGHTDSIHEWKPDGESYANFFVYIKKKPNYKVTQDVFHDRASSVKMVEIQALEDALSLRRTSESLNESEKQLLIALIKLTTEDDPIPDP